MTWFFVDLTVISSRCCAVVGCKEDWDFYPNEERRVAELMRVQPEKLTDQQLMLTRDVLSVSAQIGRGEPKASAESSDSPDH